MADHGTAGPIQTSVSIAAPTPVVWRVLTDPELMKRWMGEPEMELEVRTTWRVGSPVVISGTHHVRFSKDGTVLRFEPERLLAYSHRSSLSDLPDEPASYTELEFALSAAGTGTSLTFTARNFPTESVYRHLALYWKGTMQVVKRVADQLAEQR